MKNQNNDASFFSDEPAHPIADSHTLVSYADWMNIPSADLSTPTGNDNARPAVNCALMLLETMAYNRDFPRIFVRRLHTALSLAGSSYVQEILLLAIAGQPLPGPLEFAARNGITKQAVSREILDAIARIRAEDPGLADMLDAARVTYHADDPSGARAPRPREHAYPVQASMCDGRTVLRVEFPDGFRDATMSLERDTGKLTFLLLGGSGEKRTCEKKKAAWICEETDRGTVVSQPFIKVA